MARNQFRLILEILRRETDKQHWLSTKELITILNDSYGISVTPLTIRRDIDTLNEYGECVKIKVGAHNRFFYRYVNRDFPIEDVRILVDSVFINRFLTAAQKDALLSRFRKVVSRHEVDTLRSLVFLNDNCEIKHDLLKNKQLIDRAISEKRYVSFRYERYGADKQLIFDGKQRRIIPLTVIYDQNKYYISAIDCLDGHVNKTFRIDKMADVRLLEGIAEEFERPLPNYSASRFEMFSGDDTYEAKFRVRRNLFDYMIERFGTEVKMRPDFDNPDYAIVTQRIQHSKGLIRWIMTQGSDLEVISPESLRTEVAQALRVTLRLYE